MTSSPKLPRLIRLVPLKKAATVLRAKATACPISAIEGRPATLEHPACSTKISRQKGSS
ncbi:MAG TPA: hypothetical protein VFC19_30205 [Candidatus Limnocylindrales bacterium]|nr:hypothetical protein [Candidatus Limnocylindrales bacterium]